LKTDFSSVFSALQIHVTGRIQGVGFRPFVYRIAKELGINGHIFNRPDGIFIHAEGSLTVLKTFIKKIQIDKPHAAEIKKIEEIQIEPENIKSFAILPSQQSGYIITEICPDIAICPDCLNELKNDNKRKNYPFNNCTNCGPRFTIVNDFPYDREHTSMDKFAMCDRCNDEYINPVDRRFHAQPVSCPNCGPVYIYCKGNESISDNLLSVQQSAADINQGKIIAIKGLGGYNLACDAYNADAIKELRGFKRREKKPFALMFRTIEDIDALAEINETEKAALLCWQRPIVVLTLKNRDIINNDITSGLITVGAFLPYLPLHYILFENLKTNAILLTSGNESDTPILFQNDAALNSFQNISGGVLINNRAIIHRIDDSVVRVISDQMVLFRRARGYVPSPIDLDYNVDGILATGAELSNCFCIGKENQAIMSQHIGDLQNLETYEFYCQNIREFSRLYRIRLHTIACDLHPDYLSTRYAEESVFNIIFTQHHHAHIASCMAEYGLQGPVIGLCYDGTGLGADGNIWGSEIIIADYYDFQRISHFEYIPIQGGDQSVYHPWRTALSYLHHTFGKDWFRSDIPLIKSIDSNKAQNLIDAIEKNINCSLSCSAGRLFDAVSALLCICLESNYHAEAPMLLENYINPKITGSYSFEGSEVISFKSMIKEIVADILKKEKTDTIATKFHNTIALAAIHQIEFASKLQNLNSVVLSGGCFQNKYLTEKLLNLLRNKGFNTYLPHLVPVNDGGIALGQLMITAHKTKYYVPGNTCKNY
jgi:hydrogenase maturation protein HypF